MKHQLEAYFDNRQYTIIQGEASHARPWKHTSPCISKSTLLPRVLLSQHDGDSISMERALRQIKDLMENNIYDHTTTEEDSAAFLDKVNASLDDIKTMLASIS